MARLVGWSSPFPSSWCAFQSQGACGASGSVSSARHRSGGHRAASAPRHSAHLARAGGSSDKVQKDQGPAGESEPELSQKAGRARLFCTCARQGWWHAIDREYPEFRCRPAGSGHDPSADESVETVVHGASSERAVGNVEELRLHVIPGKHARRFRAGAARALHPDAAWKQRVRADCSWNPGHRKVAAAASAASRTLRRKRPAASAFGAEHASVPFAYCTVRRAAGRWLAASRTERRTGSRVAFGMAGATRDAFRRVVEKNADESYLIVSRWLCSGRSFSVRGDRAGEVAMSRVNCNILIDLLSLCPLVVAGGAAP